MAMKVRDLDPERLVRLILESIEVSAACGDCGKLSLEMLMSVTPISS